MALPLGPVVTAAGSGLGDLLTSQQQGVQTLNRIVDALAALSPHFSSGRLTAATLIQTGFVRLTGISLLTAVIGGTLNDVGFVSAATIGNTVYAIPAQTGYIPLNIPFMAGLVYLPATAQAAALFYTRT